MARSVPIYDTQVTVAPGVFPLSTPHVDKSVHRGRVRPEVHGKTAPIGDLVKKVPNGTLSLESSTRSEEHTSELQSLMRISYAVFCLKKKISHISSFFPYLLFITFFFFSTFFF